MGNHGVGEKELVGSVRWREWLIRRKRKILVDI